MGLEGSWAYHPSHGSQAPWKAASGEVAKAFPALNDPRKIEVLRDQAASQRFIDKLPIIDRPTTTYAMNADALKAKYPGVIYGKNLAEAWAHEGKDLPAEERFTVVMSHPLPDPKVKLDGAHLDPHQSRIIAIARESDMRACKAPKGYVGWKHNAARSDASFFKTSTGRYVWRSIMQRFGHYFGGAHEGLSLPKNMGLILASLGVTSVTLSAFLYGVLEMADYETVDAKLALHKKKKREEQQNQPLMQPMV